MVPPDLANSDHPEITGIRCSAANSMIFLRCSMTSPTGRTIIPSAPASRMRKRRLDFSARPHLSIGKLDTEPLGALLGFFQLAGLPRMQWIGQYRQALDVRKRLSQ